MFKKVFLLFCLALSFITFSCSKDHDNEPTPPATVQPTIIPELENTRWEGTQEYYKDNKKVRSTFVIMIFKSGNQVNIIVPEGSLNKLYYYLQRDNVFTLVKHADYFLQEATEDSLTLEAIVDGNPVVLRLRKKPFSEI